MKSRLERYHEIEKIKQKQEEEMLIRTTKQVNKLEKLVKFILKVFSWLFFIYGSISYFLDGVQTWTAFIIAFVMMILAKLI